MTTPATTARPKTGTLKSTFFREIDFLQDGSIEPAGSSALHSTTRSSKTAPLGGGFLAMNVLNGSQLSVETCATCFFCKNP